MFHKKKKDYTNLWIIGITMAITLLIIVGASFAQSKNAVSGAPQNNVVSQMSLSESSYDFGSISMANGKVTKVFSITNNTSETIVAQKLYTSCMCTEATLQKSDESFGPFGMPAHGAIPSIDQDIEPGETAQVEVVFDPAAHGPAGVGPIEREVTLETSDGKAVFSFKANVMP